MKNPSRHVDKLAGLRFALRRLDGILGSSSPTLSVAMMSLTNDIRDIQKAKTRARKAQARRFKRLMHRHATRRLAAIRAKDTAPRLVMLPGFIGATEFVWPNAPAGRRDEGWSVERVAYVTDLGDGVVPDHGPHETTTFPTLEAAVASCKSELLPFAIVSVVAGAPRPDGTVVTARLIPARESGLFYVLRLDAGPDGAHYHGDRAQGPHPLLEAMKVAWGLVEHPSEPPPPPCPCLTPSSEPPAAAPAPAEVIGVASASEPCSACGPCEKWHGGKCCVCKREFSS